MTAMLLSVLALPASFVFHFVLERFWFCRNPPRSRQKAVAKIGLCVVLLCVILALLLGSDAWTLAYVFIASSGIAHLYFHIFNFTETARRIRILTAKRAGESLESYGPEVMIDERVRRLVDMGSLAEHEGKLSVRRGVMWLASHFFDLWGKLFGISSIS